MKENQIQELVNELRDIAIEYHGTQQLRERIARTVRAAMLQLSGNSEQLNQAPVKQPSNVEQVADLYAPCWKPGDVVTYTLDPEKATIWLNNYSGTCVQEYVNLERLQEDTKHGLFEVAIARFSKMNEGFPIKRFKADWVISWMLENFPPVAQKQGDN
ncbi:hypothetical protein ACE3W5_004493 [Salmonella enterica]